MENRVTSLEWKSKIQTVVIVILVIAVIWSHISPTNKSNNDILKIKEIIIEDAIGKPRIAMGYPIDNEFRKRKDTLSGIVFLDEKVLIEFILENTVNCI